METLRGDYIDKSQQLFYDNSKYVEFNQRFCKDREKQIFNILKLTSLANQQNNDLQNENCKLKYEVGRFIKILINNKRKILIIRNL